jgi:hypothetical protein
MGLSGRSAKALAVVLAVGGMWLVGDARLPDSLCSLWLRLSLSGVMGRAPCEDLSLYAAHPPRAGFRRSADALPLARLNIRQHVAFPSLLLCDQPVHATRWASLTLRALGVLRVS